MGRLTHLLTASKARESPFSSPSKWLHEAVLIHLWFSMSSGAALVVNAAGLHLATVAMVFVGAQIWLGRKLSWPKLAQRRQIRRWHFWVMVGLVAFILAHVALDSALVQTLLPSV